MSAEDKSATARARARAQGLLHYSQRQVDRVVSPSTQEQAIESTTSFASQRPILSLFIAAQALCSLFPLLLFTGFVLSTIVFAALSAVAWVLFWTSIGMLLLVPTLFFTSGLAILVWLWAVGTYFIARAIYNRLPVNVRGAMQVKMPGGKQVIFHKDSPSGNGFDTIKAEAAEVRD